MYTIFLDPGHGGKDPGAVGNGLSEKDVNLSIALKTGHILEEHGVNVVYSRIDDRLVELAHRAKVASDLGAHVFLSIHCNGFNRPSAKGVESYAHSNSALGIKLAKSIQNSIISSGAYTINRGIKTANFAVLRLATMPAALVELAFITNPEDASILKNRQDDLATALARGLLNYLGIAYRDNKALVLYKVQIGAFKSRANAEKLSKELRNMGYDTHIVAEEVK